jgi:transcriptional regulator with XRE-family HTH domain
VELQRAQELGRKLRTRREELGLSTRRLAEQAGMDDATVVRLEQGLFAAPRPDKLSRIADALGLSLADVFAFAEYVVPDDLPSFHPYLLSKYPNMPEGAIDDLLREFDRITHEYDYALEGAQEGEGKAP